MFDYSRKITTDNPALEIEQAAVLLEKSIGMQYFKEGIEKLKEGDPGGAGMGRYGQPGLIPPLAYIWCRAREELIFGELGGTFKAGYASARLRALGEDIRLLGRMEGLEKIFARLKTSETFELACFTLSVAAAYRINEIPVSFTGAIDPKATIITTVPRDRPITICCCQWEIQSEMDECTHTRTEKFFPLEKLSGSMPELLYINTIENRPSPKPDPEISRAIAGWLKENGSAVKAVILSRGVIHSNQKGLTFSRDSRIVTTPGSPELVSPEYNIYLPS